MKQFNTIATGFVFSLVLLTSGLFAQNQTISIQGTLKDANGASVDDGTQSVTFRLYDALTAGNNLWEETAPVTVVGGIYSHNLGKVTPLTGGDFANTVYLGVKVGGIELSPRTEMTYAPYAISVNSAQQIAQGGCSGQVGDLKYSILPPAQFATQNGNCWVPMDGRGISGTRLASLMGITIAPDMSGLFVRATEYSGNRDPDRNILASPTLQGDGNESHRHGVGFETTGGGEHQHTSLVGPFGYSTAGAGTPALIVSFGSGVPNRLEAGTATNGPHEHDVIGDTNPSGGSETRPKNMNFFIYIRVD
jgi:hypothetical protein